MSMARVRGASHAAGELEEGAGEGRSNERGVLAGRRAWRIRLPHRADGWSMLLAFLFALFVPLWFFASAWWNPHYEPVRGWVWSLPWIFALVYLVAQLFFLFVSAVDSDRIGISDMGVSLVALLSVFGTIIVLVVCDVLGKYHLGGFQTHELIAYFCTALCELAFTAWARFLVNRRTFAAVSTGDHQGS